MEFKKEDLLTYDELEEYIKCDQTHKKAQILTDKLKKYCFIRAFKKKTIFYRLQKEIYYKHSDANVDEKIQFEATLLIEKSVSALKESKLDKLLKQTYPDVYRDMFKNKSIKEIEPQLKHYLTLKESADNMDSTLDNNPYEIHF
jgi:hypothetical protein